MSCAPEDAACPVAAIGRSADIDNASQMTDQRHVRVSRCPIAATIAMIAAQRHDEATSTEEMARSHWSGDSESVSFCPDTSDRVSGMSIAAHTAHTALAIEAQCCER
jgi:hypothetical protein